MTRQEILRTALELTTGDRNKTYGDPKINLGCAGELKDVLAAYISDNARLFTPAEREALDQCCTKLARIATGIYKEDNYLDLAAYAAIAGECGEQEPFKSASSFSLEEQLMKKHT